MARAVGNDEIVRTLSGSLLTGDEIDRLAASLVATRGRMNVTEHEIRQLLRWARQARLHAAMLKLVLEGLVDFDLDSAGQPALVRREG